MSTPNQRTKELLEAEGYRVGLVERFNSWAQTRHDLFGFIDLIAIRADETLAVQATTNSNLAARRKKILSSAALPAVLAANWRIEVWGWRKRGGRWTVRRKQVEAKVSAG